MFHHRSRRRRVLGLARLRRRYRRRRRQKVFGLVRSRQLFQSRGYLTHSEKDFPPAWSILLFIELVLHLSHLKEMYSQGIHLSYELKL